jgi:hypothetical protein
MLQAKLPQRRTRRMHLTVCPVNGTVKIHVATREREV